MFEMNALAAEYTYGDLVENESRHTHTHTHTHNMPSSCVQSHHTLQNSIHCVLVAYTQNICMLLRSYIWPYDLCCACSCSQRFSRGLVMSTILSLRSCFTMRN